MKKQNLKSNSAITLVALIITIIVLLILAIVSINLVINSGIISKTKYAVDKYNEEEMKEQIGLLMQEMKMQQFLSDGNQEEILRSILTLHDNSATVTKSNAVYEVTYMGKSFLIGNNLEYIPRVDADSDEWEFNERYQQLGEYKGDLTTKRGNQEIGEVIIPNYYNGKRVKIIGGSTFKDNTDLTKLTISDGIEEIYGETFRGCTNLKGDLIIPNSVTSIGRFAFSNCTSLDGTLKLGNNCRIINSGAFNTCNKLIGDLIIPDSVTLIGESAFSGCSSFNGNIRLSNNLITIGGSAFHSCSNFKGNLIIPDSVTSIGGSAFRYMSSLDGQIVLSSNVQKIEDYTFLNCNSIKSIKIKNRNIQISRDSIKSTIKILGYKGSTAETYARENGRTFEEIKD